MLTDAAKVLDEGREALAKLYATKAESQHLKGRSTLSDVVGRVVRVKWRDPRGAGGSWMLVQEAVACPPSNCVTWGKCVQLTQDFIVVAASVSKADKYGPELVGDVMSIPIELVDEVTFLKKA